MKAIPRRHRLSLEELQAEYVLPARPVIITGVLDDWPAMKRWRPPSELGKRGGKALAPLISMPKSRFRRYWRPTDTEGPTLLSAVDTPFDECIERVFSPDGCAYIHHFPLLSAAPQLAEDFSHPFPGLDRSDTPVTFWIGSSGSLSSLHFDLGHNFLCMVTGKKRLFIFSREQSHRLYPCFDEKHSELSPAEGVDEGRYPSFARAEFNEVTLEAGEVLFLPHLWWHQVITDESSVMLTWFWHTEEMLHDVARLGECKAVLDLKDFQRALSLIGAFQTEAYRNMLYAATVRLSRAAGDMDSCRRAHGHLSDLRHSQALAELLS
jgi:hypothetical protein